MIVTTTAGEATATANIPEEIREFGGLTSLIRQRVPQWHIQDVMEVSSNTKNS